jgi:hypothetical protein
MLNPEQRHFRAGLFQHLLIGLEYTAIPTRRDGVTTGAFLRWLVVSLRFAGLVLNSYCDIPFFMTLIDIPVGLYYLLHRVAFIYH